MLVPLFGSKCREQVLQYIEANESAYATEIKHFYNLSLDPIQKQLEKPGRVKKNHFINMNILAKR